MRLFEVQFDVFFEISPFCLSVIGSSKGPQWLLFWEKFDLLFFKSWHCYDFWGPMGATFLLWILSNGLHCAHELRISNLKHKGSCFHQLQTLFVESDIVQQLDLRFVIFLSS